MFFSEMFFNENLSIKFSNNFVLMIINQCDNFHYYMLCTEKFNEMINFRQKKNPYPPLIRSQSPSFFLKEMTENCLYFINKN